MAQSDIVGISQIAGTVAVILSLIFVGVQIRHNTMTARASALQLNAEYCQNFFAIMGDPKYGKSYSRGALGRADLSGDEFGQFFFLCRAIFMGCENQHDQYRAGLIDTDAYTGYEATIREQIAAFPGVRAVWQLVRRTFGTDFRAFFDAQIASAAPCDPASVRTRWVRALETERAGGHGAAGPEERSDTAEIHSDTEAGG